GGSIGVGGPPPQSKVAPAAPPERTVFNQYCVGCHNDKLKTAGLALDTISAEAVSRHPEEWEKVVRRLRARQMPPAGMLRPDDRTYATVMSSLAASLDKVAASQPNPGRTDTFRRLSRTEYQNAVKEYTF